MYSAIRYNYLKGVLPSDNYVFNSRHKQEDLDLENVVITNIARATIQEPNYLFHQYYLGMKAMKEVRKVVILSTSASKIYSHF